MNKWYYYLIALVVVILDQITKITADSWLELYERIPVTPFFNITLAYNTGAAFNFLADAGGWQRWFFTIIKVAVSVFLMVWLWRLARSERWLGVALGLILGGALGNLIDRALYGHVVDFIQVYWGTAYFPSFNIADSAITCGTILLLGLTLFEKKPDEKAASQ